MLLVAANWGRSAMIQSGKQTVKLGKGHHHPWTWGKPARQFNVMQDIVNALVADGFISLCAINLTFQSKYKIYN